MDRESETVLQGLHLAEAELAVLKQEGVLRNLLSTGEPTAEAAAQLAKLRQLVNKLAASDNGRAASNDGEKA